MNKLADPNLVDIGKSSRIFFLLFEVFDIRWLFIGTETTASLALITSFLTTECLVGQAEREVLCILPVHQDKGFEE